MKFKTGDKVKFLNEKGGGVISKIISNELVYVSIDDGFEIPVHSGDLIPDMSDNKNNEPVNTSYKEPSVQNNEEKKENAKEQDEGNNIPLHLHMSKNSLSKGIYIAFVPENQNILTIDPVNIYLINYTDKDVLYNLFLKSPSDNGYTGTAYGIIDAGSMLHAGTAERNEINNWAEGTMQIMYFQDKTNRIIVPVCQDFSIKPSKFQKETNYKDSPFLIEKALLVTIDETAEQTFVFNEEPPENPYSKGKVNSIIQNIDEKKETDMSFIKKHLIDEKTAEVDMHIWKLIEDYSKMTNSEMINIQLDYLKRCMESAFENRLAKVVLIHGVGNGTLRGEVRKILGEYPNVEYMDASMQKYGVGATEVKIRYI